MEGIAKAKAAGIYKGRCPSIETAQVRALKAEGVGPAGIARHRGIARASVYRALGVKDEPSAGKAGFDPNAPQP
jgi:DNA invertase Pin-like site-specific DNA recombinase